MTSCSPAMRHEPSAFPDERRPLGNAGDRETGRGELEGPPEMVRALPES